MAQRIRITTSSGVPLEGGEIEYVGGDAEDIRERAELGCPRPLGPSGPNVLLITIDDAWAGEFSAYGLDPGENEASTPNVNRLAGTGVVFERAYSKPLCSPSRASVNTGRYGFRTGQGQLAGEAGGAPLSLDETLIPKILCKRGYLSACIGKWHLAGKANGNQRHPILAGYGFWQGSIRNLQLPAEDHYRWDRTTAWPYAFAPDGVDVLVERIERWSAEQTVDDALAWIKAQSDPWFCSVNFNSVHTPLQGPPAGTFDAAAYPDVVPGTEDGPRIQRFKAMVENLDHELGRLLAGIAPDKVARTHIVVTADNGSDQVLSPWPSSHNKRTCYEPGIHIPLIWNGPGVAGGGRRYPHWIQLEDVFFTLGVLAGTDFAADWPELSLDGLSFVPVLTDPATGELRTACYTEAFSPNVPHQGAILGGIRAIQVLHSDGKRYKLMRFVAGIQPDVTDELYCLTDDPVELTNLTPGGLTDSLTPVQLDAYNRLRSEFIAIVSS